MDMPQKAGIIEIRTGLTGMICCQIWRHQVTYTATGFCSSEAHFRNSTAES